MRILLDTNIFILREDYKVISHELQELLKVLAENKTETLVHPLSIEELKKDKNESRREIILSKVGSYPQLESPPDPSKSEDYRKIFADTNEHERVDNNLLFAIYKNAVDFLITEDRGIHKKAIEIDVHDRVLLIDDALDMFKKNIPDSKPHLPQLKEVPVYNLDKNDTIFDDLKKDYPEFDVWFEKISKEGRKCWVNYENDGKIGALLIFKIEDELIDSNPPLHKKKRLKISTFIVKSVGYKIGELFIKTSIDLCIKNGLNEMYLTHFTKQDDDKLVILISEYGFRKVASNDRGEDIYLKKLVPDSIPSTVLQPLQIIKEYYPSFYDGNKVKKYIVPIRSQFYNRLFIDSPDRPITITEYGGEFIVEGNTIKKAYLTNSKITKIKPGDVILFYRSIDKSDVSSIGVVESIYMRLTDPDEVIKHVGKRTVYSIDEIKEMAKKPTTVILFYYIRYFPNPIKYTDLVEICAISGPPQSILEIDENSYHEIIKRCGIDERFTIH
ncbi:MAG: PIN domain-containing protein [Thermoplasmata archaeon]